MELENLPEVKLDFLEVKVDPLEVTLEPIKVTLPELKIDLTQLDTVTELDLPNWDNLGVM